MPAQWHQNSIIYAVAVDRFQDSDGDGVGDLEGLRQRLPYIAELGVDCLWLLPFYRSPMRDEGYDVSDHRSVDERYGTIGDVREVVRQADQLGIRVVVDLVVNHTSIDHRWFRTACHDRASRFHDFYVWTDDPAEAPSPHRVMPPVQKEVWTRRDETGEYYLHHFFSHEPDLDTRNPDVVRELLDIVAFWIDQGVSGFRVDAVPYAVAKAGGVSQNGEFDADSGHWLVEEIRSFADAHTPASTFLFGEANIAPDAQQQLFGTGSPELHGLYNFTSNQHLFLSLADGSAEPLRRGLSQLTERPAWAVDVNWVRNLDELDLKQLDKDERQRVIDRFAPEDDGSHLFQGIVHRAPALLDDDRMLRLAYSAAFSLPGIPMLFYGEEIALGDDLSQEGRQAVRPPMQWDNGPNAGFCAEGVEAEQPVVGDQGRPGTNVADQKQDPDSLFRWMRRLVGVRHGCPAIGAGNWHLIEDADDGSLAMASELDGVRVVTLHNFSSDAAVVDSTTVATLAHRRQVFSDQPYQPLTELADQLHVEGLGYRWITGEIG